MSSLDIKGVSNFLLNLEKQKPVTERKPQNKLPKISV